MTITLTLSDDDVTLAARQWGWTATVTVNKTNGDVPVFVDAPNPVSATDFVASYLARQVQSASQNYQVDQAAAAAVQKVMGTP